MTYHSLISNHTATLQDIYGIIESLVECCTELDRNQHGEVELITYEWGGRIYHVTFVHGHPKFLELDRIYLFELPELQYNILED